MSIIDSNGNPISSSPFGNEFPFNNFNITPAAFRPEDTNSYITKSIFYASINGEFYNFYNRFIRRWLYWYDGWDPDFHNSCNGIFSTRIGTAIVDKIVKKVVGGRIMFKNKGRVQANNNALTYISEDFAENSNFAQTVKNAALYAAAGGTALVKLNRDSKGELWTDVMRIDQFYPTIGFRGQILDVLCYLKRYTATREVITGNGRKTKYADLSYYLVEHRYFGDYTRLDGSTLYDVPQVRYMVHELQGNIENGTDYALDNQQIVKFETLPYSVQKSIYEDYGVYDDRPIRLPFDNHLGCEIVKWSSSVPGLPEVPYGESIINRILALCIMYDFASSAFATDLYTARSSVLLPANMIGNTNVNGVKNNNWFSSLDSFVYKLVPNLSLENQKPVPIQFDLRAESWESIQNKLFKQMAMHLGLNPSFISASLNDNTARTAREVSTEENDTAEYVNDMRAIIERPLNKLLNLVLKDKGYEDSVVLRWSSAGLTNRSTLAEFVNSCTQAGNMSKEKAIHMLNYDDDELQVQEEYNRIKTEQKENAFGGQDMDRQDYFEDDKLPDNSNDFDGNNA